MGQNGVLYNPNMGENVNSTVHFKDDGSVHQTVYDHNGGGRYSWDQDSNGNADDPHFTDQDARSEDQRHPFGRWPNTNLHYQLVY